MNKCKNRLYERLDRRAFWVKNYIKTITASTMITTGIGLFITGELTRMQNHGISDAEIILGASCFILALIITFVLDYYANRKEKENYQVIEDYIDERSEEIAKELIVKHLEKIAKENDLKNDTGE